MISDCDNDLGLSHRDTVYPGIQLITIKEWESGAVYEGGKISEPEKVRN